VPLSAVHETTTTVTDTKSADDHDAPKAETIDDDKGDHRCTTQCSS